MRIVISASNGDVLFSGNSVLSIPVTWDEELEEDFGDDAERTSEPPASGVFPMAAWLLDSEADNDDEPQPELRPSGIFPRNASYDEASEDLSLEDIDRSWEKVAV